MNSKTAIVFVIIIFTIFIYFIKHEKKKNFFVH